MFRAMPRPSPVPPDWRPREFSIPGHHHVLIDLEQPPDLDEPIPRDARYVHLDGGETEALLDLTPGEHTLQLLLGDEDHEPHAPALLSDKIRIIVR